MSYLIFTNEQDAYDRAEEQGKLDGLAYHKGDPDGTRYSGAILETGDNKYALLVEGFDLSDQEQSQVVDAYIEKEFNLLLG